MGSGGVASRAAIRAARVFSREPGSSRMSPWCSRASNSVNCAYPTSRAARVITPTRYGSRSPAHARAAVRGNPLIVCAVWTRVTMVRGAIRRIGANPAAACATAAGCPHRHTGAPAAYRAARSSSARASTCSVYRVTATLWRADTALIDPLGRRDHTLGLILLHPDS